MVSRSSPLPSGGVREAGETGASITEVLVVFAAYTVLTVWLLWPIPRVLATRSGYLYDLEADYDLILWALSWGAHALMTAPWRLFHANTLYPSVGDGPLERCGVRPLEIEVRVAAP